jgi:hypothetical protein
MPNLLKMAKVQSILSLHAQGRSQREIARTLGVDRGTVHKYLRLGLCGPKPAIAPAGSDPSKPAAPGADRRVASAARLKTGQCADRAAGSAESVRAVSRHDSREDSRRLVGAADLPRSRGERRDRQLRQRAAVSP